MKICYLNLSQELQKELEREQNLLALVASHLYRMAAPLAIWLNAQELLTLPLLFVPPTQRHLEMNPHQDPIPLLSITPRLRFNGARVTILDNGTQALVEVLEDHSERSRYATGYDYAAQCITLFTATLRQDAEGMSVQPESLCKLLCLHELAHYFMMAPEGATAMGANFAQWRATHGDARRLHEALALWVVNEYGPVICADGTTFDVLLRSYLCEIANPERAEAELYDVFFKDQLSGCAPSQLKDLLRRRFPALFLPLNDRPLLRP